MGSVRPRKGKCAGKKVWQILQKVKYRMNTRTSNFTTCGYAIELKPGTQICYDTQIFTVAPKAMDRTKCLLYMN